MATPTDLYVIVAFMWEGVYEKEGLHEPEVYTTKSAANSAARTLMKRYTKIIDPNCDREAWEFYHNLDDEGLYRGTLEGGPGGHKVVEMCVYKVGLNQPSTRERAKRPMDKGPASYWTESEDEDEDGDDNEDEDGADGDGDGDGDAAALPARPEPKRSTKQAAATQGKKAMAAAKTGTNPQKYRKTIPQGIPDCLKDVKILFTGTFETMDRVTSIATARKYGAEVVTKLEDTDYIVIGLRAGPKKLQIINELELETISEEEFFEILENGVSKEKRERMANKRKADEEEGPGESQEVAPKRGAAAGRKRTKR